jgi:hypothetical protein
MKSLALAVLTTCFSISAFASSATGSSWEQNYSTRHKTHGSCSTKPVTIQTACDLKSYAASAPSTTSFSFFQGYVISAFRTQQPLLAGCPFSGTDQQAVAAAIAYLNTITPQQCAAIPATDALNKAFEAGNLVSCATQY